MAGCNVSRTKGVWRHPEILSEDSLRLAAAGEWGAQSAADPGGVIELGRVEMTTANRSNPSMPSESSSPASRAVHPVPLGAWSPGVSRLATCSSFAIPISHLSYWLFLWWPPAVTSAVRHGAQIGRRKDMASQPSDLQV